MSKGLNNKLAGQIGEHLVCAELGRLGLIATPFSGNVPTFDVLAADAAGRAISIQVKASRSDNWPSDARSWMELEFNRETRTQKKLGPKTISSPKLVYVCVALAAAPRRDDRFFILTKGELQKICEASYTQWMDGLNWRRPKNPESYDCRYSVRDIESHENKWPLILEQLASVEFGDPSTPDRD